MCSSDLMMATAGCDATPKRAKISPSGSLSCVNERPYSSTKARKSSSDPYHATPRNVALPAQRVLASSTEGASLRQVPQPGAQNHSTTGRPAYCTMSTEPPPTPITAE